MNYCTNVSSLLILLLSQIGEVNCEVLFGNLREVTLVSRDLATALQETCRGGGGGGDDRVGEVFVRFGPRLRSAYATYCRNHDNASSLVEKVIIHCVDLYTYTYHTMSILLLNNTEICSK